MAFIERTIFSVIFVLAVFQTAGAQGSFGSFSGYFSNRRINRDQLAKLELIFARQDSGDIQLRALFTVQLGGFESGEYVTYHYENVVYNVITGALVFNQVNQDVYLSNITLKDGELRGDINSSNGYLGSIYLSSKETIQPSNGLVEPLGGEYRGVCKGAKPRVSSLQLYTFRSTLDTARLGNAFGAYEAKGQLGQATPGYCSSKKTTTCTYAKIKAASYNFYDGDLVLTGFPFSYSCRVNADTIECGACSFKRTSNEMKHPRTKMLHPRERIEEVAKKISENSSRALRGSYEGYIYHEALDIYQRVRLDVTTFEKRSDTGSDLMVSTVGSVYFGEGTTESLVYKFDPVPIVNPISGPQLILARPQDDVDPVVKISRIHGGVIRGVWNSNIYGRVGPFIVTRNGDLPKLPTENLIGGLTSGYEEINGERFIMDLIVAKGNAPIGSDNPFYPLTLTGYVWNRRPIIRKDSITGGSYDFYTGKIAILFGDEKAFSGFVKTDGRAQLRRLGGGFGTLMQKFAPAPFQKTNRLPR